jgi:uncharacterized protein (TIGR02145 family)
MKTTNFSGLWKAIVFLAAVLTVLFSCSSCEPEEPPVVYETSITLAVEGVTEQSATLVAEVMAGNQNLQVIFECFIGGQWQSFSAGSVSGIEKKTVKKEINSLNPNSSYRVRAYLEDSKEKKVSASQEQEFTTKEELEVSITIAAEEITEQSATLVAKVKAGNKDLQAVFEQLVNGKWEILASESVSGVEEKTLRKEFTNLNPETDYKVRAYLKDANQKEVAVSQELEFTTPKTAATVGLSIKEVGRNQVVLVASAKGRSGEESLGLWFEYFDGTAWKSVFSKNISGTEEQEVEQKIASLDANKKYQVRAYLLTDSEVKLTTSEDLEFTTIQSAFLSLVSTEVALTTIDLQLELTPYADTQVIIEYQGKGLSSQTITSEMYSGSTLLPLEFKLSNLEKNTVYTVKVKTSDDSSNKLELSLETYAVSDYDGNLYHLVTIGNQTFLRENLKATHFLNGDPIPNVKDDQDWYNFNAPAYCYYNNDPALGEKYGALYNFYAASDPRGFIAGFHTPTIEEFEELIVYLGGEYAAGGKAKTTTSDWQSPNMGASNSSGFSALPAGTRSYSSGGNYEQPEFVGLGELAKFWTGEIEPALPQMAYTPYCRYTGPGFFYNSLHFHWAGFSVRLVKD